MRLPLPLVVVIPVERDTGLIGVVVAGTHRSSQTDSYASRKRNKLTRPLGRHRQGLGFGRNLLVVYSTVAEGNIEGLVKSRFE